MSTDALNSEDLLAQLQAAQKALAEERVKASELTANAHRLIDLQAKMQALLHHASEGIIIFNGDGTVQSFNRASERIFQYAEIEVLYRPVTHLFPGAEGHPDGILGHLRSLSNSDVNAVYYGRRADGSHIPIRVALNEVVSADLTLFSDDNVFQVDTPDNTNWTFCVIHDMTSELRVQNGLREQARTLESLNKAMSEANAQKTSFLSNVGHELRTPINGILGIAQILEQCVLPADIAELVTAMRQSGDRLRHIVDDILRVSQDAGTKVYREPVDLRPLIESIVASTMDSARAKGLMFSARWTPDAPKVVTTDGRRLTIALQKILDNALKFTESGEITLAVARQESSDGEAQHVVLSVTDTGVGIAADHIEHLFTPFYQVDGTHTRRIGGAGLGLAVARQCLEAIGAQLVVSSEVNTGSTFKVIVPLREVTKTRNDPDVCDAQRLAQLQDSAGDAFNDVKEQILLDIKRHISSLVARPDPASVTTCLSDLQSTLDLLGATELQRLCFQYLERCQAGDSKALVQLHESLDQAVARLAEVLSAAVCAAA